MAWYICGYRGDNAIEEKGCKHLSKAAWAELKEIRLGHCSLTQMKTKSGTGAAGTSAREAGRSYKELTWVFIKIFRLLWCEGGGVQGYGQAVGEPAEFYRLYISRNSG